MALAVWWVQEYSPQWAARPHPAVNMVNRAPDRSPQHWTWRLASGWRRRERALLLPSLLPDTVSSLGQKWLFRARLTWAPIEKGMNCGSLTTWPWVSRKRSGLNARPSCQWLPFRISAYKPTIMVLAGTVNPLTSKSLSDTWVSPCGAMFATLCTSMMAAWE